MLSNVNMDVPEGESVSVFGANGSGKSTLLRMLSGVSRPTRGRISGFPSIIGYVPDRFPAVDAMSSIAYLTHVGRMRGLRTAAAARRGRLLLDRLELVGGVKLPIRALSKGNAQKVALSQALMVPPQLLVLDEPWSGLDAAAHGVLGEILDEVVQDGGTVIFTDHRESISRSHATLTFSLENGEVSRAEQRHRREHSQAAQVVLTDAHGGRGGPRQVDWYRLEGVVAVTPTAEFVHIQVRADACDELLMIALRGGWSVAEVRRGDTSERRDRGANAWAR